MRIAFLTTTSLDSPYGVGRCLPIALQMREFGHQVHIVALHHDLTPAVERQFRYRGVHVRYVGQMHVRKHGDTSSYFSLPRLVQVVLSGTIGLIRGAAAVDADVYHVGKPHPQNSIAGLTVSRLLKRHNRRLIVDCDDYEAGVNRFSSRYQYWLARWLENTVPRLADGVTANTRFQETRLAELGISAEQIFSLPSCVDPERFAAVSPKRISVWRSRLGITDEDVIMYVSTLSLANHPVDLLLHAMAELVRSRPNTLLVIVGGGPDLELLQTMAEDIGIANRCRFVGRVDSTDIPALFRLADVSVDPVEDNLVARARFPLKIIESFAAGVPVVTGDVGDRRTMIGDGLAGMVVEPGDAQPLAAGLQQILADSELRAQLRAGCVERARAYHPHDVTARLLAFYNEV